jgi:long-chain acyl-CoA synthetase
LQAEGCSPGDRVGLFAENGPFFIAAYLGAIRAGLCAVPFPTDCSQATFERIVASTGMKRLLVSARFHEQLQSWPESSSLALLVETTDPPHAEQNVPPPVEVDLKDHLAAIMFTAGSTGEPKGVMVTHQNILVNTEDILAYTRLGPDDRAMIVLPFFYCYGTSLLHTHLMAGASLVINNRFLFPEKVLDEMEQKGCTGLAGVPATYQILLRKTRLAQRRFPALRWLQQAGGRLPNPLVRELRQALPGVQLFVMYGQTEATARLSYLPPERLDDKLGSIGCGLPHVRLEVLRTDGTPVAPGSDEVGQIVASGESITVGYWGDAEETAHYFRDGKLQTGDMARVDADGFIFIVERARDFIKAMGYRVGPKEVEEVLAEMPEIVEAAVVGVPDELWG